MAKKLLALTLVLVLVAGFTAMAAEEAEEKVLTGSYGAGWRKPVFEFLLGFYLRGDSNEI